jgi:hypothetical protein
LAVARYEAGAEARFPVGFVVALLMRLRTQAALCFQLLGGLLVPENGFVP